LEHQKLCYNHESINTKLTSKFKKDTDGNVKEDKNYKIRFKNHNKMFMHPFNCFLDFESTLTNVDEKKGDNSTVYQKHEENSCGLKCNCIYDQ